MSAPHKRQTESLLCPPCETYCFLPEEMRKKRWKRKRGGRRGVKSTIVTAKGLEPWVGDYRNSSYVLHASAGKMSSYAGGSSLDNG